MYFLKTTFQHQKFIEKPFLFMYNENKNRRIDHGR